MINTLYTGLDNQIRYQASDENFGVAEMISKMKEVTVEYDGKSYSQMNNNCQTFVRKCLIAMKVFSEKMYKSIPLEYNLIYVNERSGSSQTVSTISKSVVNFLEELYKNPSEITFKELEVKSTNVADYINMIQGNHILDQPEIDAHMYRIASSYYYNQAIMDKQLFRFNFTTLLAIYTRALTEVHTEVSSIVTNDGIHYF
jgi:hypothetical protein